VSRRAARAPLPATARDRILDAALAEFIARGFNGASTNTIARAAGVAKGLVFHHFASKADLFLAVHDHVTRRIGAQVLELPSGPIDLFSWLRESATRKLRVLRQDPTAYQFVLAARDAPPPLRAEIERRLVAIRQLTWDLVRGSIDTSRLRPGLTLDQAIETLTILGEGLDRRYTPRVGALPDRGFSQLEAVAEEVWTHYERLRDGIYAPAPPPPPARVEAAAPRGGRAARAARARPPRARTARRARRGARRGIVTLAG
jgi:AcrR family transcriptional regulator